MTAHMRTSRAGLDLMKRFEGYRARYEQLPDGRWIIGYGHVRRSREGARVTEAEAEAILREYDLPKIERVVRQSVLAPLNQNEFDALVSLAFNIGAEAFRSSDVVAAVNGGNRLQAAQAFDVWRHADIGGRVQLVDVLVRRRAAEKALFLTTIGRTPDAASSLYRAVRDPGAIPLSPPRLSAPSMSAPRISANENVVPEMAKRGAYITSAAVSEEPARSATEEAAEAVRLQMEKILNDETPVENGAIAPEMPLPELDGEPASPEEITAAISELAGADAGGVRKSVWPRHAGLSPPPAFERRLTAPPAPAKSEPEPDLHIGRIDDLEEVMVDPKQIAKAVVANEQNETEIRRSSAAGGLFQGLMALFGLALFGYGLGRQFDFVPALTPEVGPLAEYLPGFLILYGLLLAVVMGYYCYRSIREPE